jgi:hypothetical protein
MATKQKKKAGSEKLSLVPTLSEDAVRSQLESAMHKSNPEIQIPEELVSALCETGEPGKVSEVSGSLAKIAGHAEESAKEAIAAFSDKSLCAQLIQNPKAFVAIARNADDAAPEAFSMLKHECLSSLLSKDRRELFSLIWQADLRLSYASKEGFFLLGRKDVASAFAKNPQRIIDALRKILNAFAVDAGKEALMVLATKPLASAFAKNPEKIADALAKLGSESADMYVGGRPAIWLLGKREIAPAFAKNPDRIADALVKMGEALKDDAESAFFALSKKELAEAFAKNPEKIADAFVNAGESLGDSTNSFFKFLASNKNSREAFLILARGEGVGSQYTFNIVLELADEFSSDPVKVAKIIDKTIRIMGRRSDLLPVLLTYECFRVPVSGNLEKLVKFAEATSYLDITELLVKVITGEENSRGAKYSHVTELLERLDNPEELHKRTPLLMPLLEGHRECIGKWREGRELAREAGLLIEDREVFINFAYAKEVIGREKAIALHREFGIEYFARYTKGELEELYKHVSDLEDNRPLFVFAHSKSDYSGAFYDDFKLRRGIAKDAYYNMIFVEVETEGEFYSLAKKAGDKYFGISILQLAAHGNADKIRMGSGKSEEYLIDLTDRKRLKELHGSFVGNPLVILVVCSAGKSEQAMGAAISGIWGAELSTSEGISFPTAYEKDGKRVTGLSYAEGGTKFISGRKLKERQEP